MVFLNGIGLDFLTGAKLRIRFLFRVKSFTVDRWFIDSAEIYLNDKQKKSIEIVKLIRKCSIVFTDPVEFLWEILFLFDSTVVSNECSSVCIFNEMMKFVMTFKLIIRQNSSDSHRWMQTRRCVFYYLKIIDSLLILNFIHVYMYLMLSRSRKFLLGFLCVVRYWIEYQLQLAERFRIHSQKQKKIK